jgi:hypothetical protein
MEWIQGQEKMSKLSVYSISFFSFTVTTRHPDFAFGPHIRTQLNPFSLAWKHLQTSIEGLDAYHFDNL